MCQEQIGGLRSPTMAPVSLMACLLSRNPGLGPAWLRRSQNSLMLKWETLSGASGTKVSVTHATFAAT